MAIIGLQACGSCQRSRNANRPDCNEQSAGRFPVSVAGRGFGGPCLTEMTAEHQLLRTLEGSVMVEVACSTETPANGEVLTCQARTIGMYSYERGIDG